MGWFDSITQGISNVVSSVKSSGVYKSLVTENPLVQGNPLVVVSKVATGQQTIGQGLQSYGKAVGTGITAAATALIPGSLAVKASTAATGLVTTGFVTSSPVKAVQVVSKAPQVLGSLTNVGANVGNFVNTPSLKTFGDIYKENPITASALTLGGLAAVGGGIGLTSNTLATIRNTAATKKNTTSPEYSIPSDFAKQFQAIAPATSKLDVDINKIARESQQDLLKSQEKITEMQAKAALDIEKQKSESAKTLAQEQTKQLEILQKNALTNPPQELTSTIKPTVKKKAKKKTKKKAKKKTKKKRKVYKSKKKKR